MAIITISRGTMSGGNELAMCLADSLGYPRLSREVLVDAAAMLGVSEETLHGKILKEVGFWERFSDDRRLYVIALQSALAEQCLTGDLIYHGHAGHLLLKGLPCVLRVRLIAPLEVRIQKVIKRDHLSHEAALNFINTQDRNRVQWCRFVYNVDWSDPFMYDMVLNLEHITTPEACGILSAAVSLPDFAITNEVRKELLNFATTCRVRLALAANSQTRHMVFEIRAEGATVEIFYEKGSGGILVRPSGPSEGEIARIARTVMGVNAANVRMHRFPEDADF